MHKARVRFTVDVDLQGKDDDEYWDRIQKVKHALQWALSETTQMQDHRDQLKHDGVKILDAQTHVILSEEVTG